MSEPEYKIVSAHVSDPTKSIFKQPANTKASCSTVSCCLDSCPLRDAGECTLKGIFPTRCPYGRVSYEEGPTRRAKSFHGWVEERKEKHEGVPSLKSPKDKIAFIGDWVYLPYAHMTMCESVPFMEHSHLFFSGTPFIKKENWNLSTIKTLLNFRPHALMGGEIKTYQKEVVPKFLVHLKEEAPDIWKELIAERPELDQNVSHVGRKALVKTLRSEFEFTTKHEKYPVSWKVSDGKMTTSSEHAYDSTWGSVERDKVGKVEVALEVTDETEIVVQSDDWVTPETKFID